MGIEKLMKSESSVILLLYDTATHCCATENTRPVYHSTAPSKLYMQWVVYTPRQCDDVEENTTYNLQSSMTFSSAYSNSIWRRIQDLGVDSKIC